MRCAKGALREQALTSLKRAGYRMNRGALQRFIEGERREDRAEPSGQHRLAGAGRTRQQEVMAAGGGNFERATSQELTANIRKIAFSRIGISNGGRSRQRARRSFRLIQGINGIRQRLRDADVQPLDDRGFGGILRWKEQSLQAEATGTNCDRKHTANTVDGAIERQLTNDDRVIHTSARQRP